MSGTPGSGPRPGRGRLSHSAEFDRVFRHGRSRAGRDLVLYLFPRSSPGPGCRLGLSVSRKVGGAVQRNRVKRLLREAFAEESCRLPPDTDAVVVARRGARELAEREGLRGVRAALAELIDQFPVSAGSAGSAGSTGLAGSAGSTGSAAGGDPGSSPESEVAVFPEGHFEAPHDSPDRSESSVR